MRAREASAPHEVLEYAQDASTLSLCREAVEALGPAVASVFMTSGADAEGVGQECAVVPVSGMLILDALTAAVTAWPSPRRRHGVAVIAWP